MRSKESTGTPPPDVTDPESSPEAFKWRHTAESEVNFIPASGGGEREGLDLELGKDGVFTFKGDSSMW